MERLGYFPIANNLFSVARGTFLNHGNLVFVDGPAKFSPSNGERGVVYYVCSLLDTTKLLCCSHPTRPMLGSKSHYYITVMKNYMKLIYKAIHNRLVLLPNNA
jgi:hypothetical protein